jgi:hypothetical protein
MKNYSVRITTKAWVTTVVNVKATDEEAARSGALLIANDRDGRLDWDFCEYMNAEGAGREDAQCVTEQRV